MEVNNRDNGFTDEMEYSLRMMNIDQNICKQIKNELNDIFQNEIINSEDTNNGLILFENIDDYVDYSKIIEVIDKYKINKNQLNIFIAFTTQCDISGFTVLQKISDLHYKIGGSIDFSIISYKK